MKKSFWGLTIVCIVILFCTSVSFKSHVNSKDGTQQIIGVWKEVSGIRPVVNIKIITKDRFIWTWTSDNKIMASAGGTYTFDGETYIENIEYGTENMSGFFGKKAVVKVRFEGDKMYYSGTLAESVALNEIWERME
jgi:hypothetical protein